MGFKKSLLDLVEKSVIILWKGDHCAGKTSVMFQLAVASSAPSVLLTNEYSEEATKSLLQTPGLQNYPCDLVKIPNVGESGR